MYKRNARTAKTLYDGMAVAASVRTRPIDSRSLAARQPPFDRKRWLSLDSVLERISLMTKPRWLVAMLLLAGSSIIAAPARGASVRDRAAYVQRRGCERGSGRAR